MTDIVVEVTKGMVTGIYCDIRNARFVVVDWDLVERDGPPDRIAIKHQHVNLNVLPLRTKNQYKRAIATPTE